MAGPVPITKTSRVRQRKLNPKHTCQVLAEDELDELESHELSQSLKEVTTGVEAIEEQEHHLQAVINAAQAAAAGAASAIQAYIPTRGTSAADIAYDEVYSHKFSQPATYIRFSSTVEDCIDGASYDLSEEDQEFLKTLNERLRTQAQQASSRPTSRSASAAAEVVPKQCSESQLEMVLQAFETAARNAAPFSNAVTGDQAAPVLTLDEQLAQLADTLSEDSIMASPSRPHSQAVLRALASLIYPHWQSRRLANNNSPLSPVLKVKFLDTGDTLDDNDPYVCFRRREVRQPRKTRNRDALSAERLRRLRRELEEARNLVALIRQREASRKDQMAVGRTLFEQRHNLRGVKRTLPEKLQEGDEELLVNQKQRRPKPLEAIQAPNRVPGMRTGPLPKNAEEEINRRRLEGAMSVSAGPELQLLSDWLQVREQRQVEEIKHKIAQHTNWNLEYVDMTRAPLTPPPPDGGIVGGFRAARTEYLPTPPASIASEEHKGLDEFGKSGMDKPAPDGLSDIGHKQRDRDVVMGGMGGPTPPSEKEVLSAGVLGVTPETSRNESPAEMSEKPGNVNEQAVDRVKPLPVRVKYAAPDSDAASKARSPAFRRRMGRGGRMFIDRRHLHRAVTPESDSEEEEDGSDMILTASLARDRFKFDNDSDDDANDDPNYVNKVMLDPLDWQSMLLRAQYSISWQANQTSAQQAQLERNKQARIQAAPAQPNGGQGSPQTVRQQVAQQAAVAQAQAAAAK